MFLALMQKIGHSYVFEWAVMALIEVEGYVNLPHTNMYLCSLCIFLSFSSDITQDGRTRTMERPYQSVSSVFSL